MMDDSEIEPIRQQFEAEENAKTHLLRDLRFLDSKPDASTPASVSLRGRLSQNVPTPSAVFTGREDELRRLHAALQTGDAVLAPTFHALNGIGGVGKTQTAAQYAHRHRHAYETVFWVIGDSPQRLQAELASLAPELAPPVEAQNELEATFRAVLDWFSAHEGWLLIVDNAEDRPALKPLLPSHPTGRVLMTTREEVPNDFGTCIAIEHLDDTTGATLLLRRAGILKPDAELNATVPSAQADAKDVSRELGGLPLALDQAGAYMQTRRLSPATYLAHYRQRGQALHRDYVDADHKRVDVTVADALEQVRRTPRLGKAAAELAQVCAFLAPDAIPDEVFTTHKLQLDDWFTPLLRGEATYADVCQAMCRHALLRRAADPPGLTMHRLTQAALCDRLSADERQEMVSRTVRAVAFGFPTPHFPAWSLCARLLPHALLCIQHIQEYYIDTPGASLLLYNTGWYLMHRAKYIKAEQFLLKALAITRQIYGEKDKQVALCLNQLGLLYSDMGYYDEAASYLQQAVAYAGRMLGEDDTIYADDLDNLATVYYRQERIEEALDLWERALDITRRELGPEHPDVAIRLNGLALAYAALERYAEAEVLRKEILTIDSRTIEQDDPRHAVHLVNLADLYIDWGFAEKAAPLLIQALSIRERAYGPQHPDVADSHYRLGYMHYTQDNLTAAFSAFLRGWEMYERTLGPQHPDTLNLREWVDRVEQEMAEE